MLPTEQRQRYIEQGGARCPFCESKVIEGKHFDFEGNEAYQRIECIDCGKEWDDIYKLINVEEVDHDPQGSEEGEDHDEVS